MLNVGKKIVKHRILILLLGVVLLVPSVLGYLKTRVNYDILYYLPSDIDTMAGQEILKEEFGKGGFAIEVVKGMDPDSVEEVKEKIAEVDGVADVISYSSLLDSSIPMEVIPERIRQYFSEGDAQLMAIFFEDTTSAEQTMQAVEKIRSVTDEHCHLAGMSSVVTDIRDIAESEMPVYVVIAAVLTCIVLSLFMDDWIVPLFFMLSIGASVVYNMGTNVFMGEISYITQALAAVLQLGVTLDYSIFLWHSYEENRTRFADDKERAMAHAISSTFSSVAGSSTTTIAGFAALCFMSFTLGMDMGIVMAKGVVFGVLTCITLLPSMILVFDKAIEKTRHRPLLPDLSRPARWIVKHYRACAALFIMLLVPSLYGYTHTDVYYDLAGTLPDSLPSRQANAELSKDFDMNATHMVLVPSDLSEADTRQMIAEMEDVDGIRFVLGLDSIVGAAVPKEVLPKEVTGQLDSGNWKLILVQSEYASATDEVNAQCTALNNIIKSYDDRGMLIGEAPCTKDLIEITDNDFKVVSVISILLVFLIIIVQFRSAVLPVILIGVIELAIFINMGIPYYTGTVIPFIASIVIGTIQLGATVDYAILMTTRYRNERLRGKDREESVYTALSSSMTSIVVSALGFFGATIGVGIYSDIDMISSLCSLISRGAIISMFVVILILPAMLMMFDHLICGTTAGMRHLIRKEEKKNA